MAAVGFASDAADSFERGGPYLVRGAADLIPTTKLLDDYRGMIFCTIRKIAGAQKRSAAVVGGNGYSLATSAGTIGGGGNPYVYPDNLPRVNAHGGPEGRPGCWQEVIARLVADAVSGDGHRLLHRAVQPHRARPTVAYRLRVGPADRRVHDQPLTVDLNFC